MMKQLSIRAAMLCFGLTVVMTGLAQFAPTEKSIVLAGIDASGKEMENEAED